ncbi:protein kilB [Streptomyces sp. NBC_00249]|uniref:protein kilB n=1 Tax=Streptomyces sp. NBC_00249 TaxID=2975690 RepID=UPI00225AD708|nr:protein kilB [Streptomyces sp. NBC_00249]MCX5195639.1 protein kilB [Streptomyces sp. NBC_00249]
MWSSIVAVVGTLAGVLTAGLLQQRAARTARAEDRADARRQEKLAAVTDLAAALDAHRSAMFHRERLAMTDTPDGPADPEARLAAQTTSHDTRAAITAPLVRLLVLVPELAAPAQGAAEATYALRNAGTTPELNALRRAAKAASLAFVTSAAALLTPDHR